MKNNYRWVQCLSGIGNQLIDGKPEVTQSHFKEHSIGLVMEDSTLNSADHSVIWLMGRDVEYLIATDEIQDVDIFETGDGMRGQKKQKICNICYCLLPLENFEPNQINVHGTVTRPSCRECRLKIDLQPRDPEQTKIIESKRPENGAPFKCPICRKLIIVGVTAKIVLDHDHNTGKVRDYICDSCNTGLGRFRNGQDFLMNAINYLKSYE